MNVQLRPMHLADVPTAEEIEREAFPTVWPPTPFKRELSNRRARYLVAALASPEEHPSEKPKEAVPVSAPTLVSRFLSSVKGLVSAKGTSSQTDPRILGFVGLWFMVDECHITSIAVREKWRGRGVGELLLIGAIELAMANGSRVVTLEVRVSNLVAQSLYQKYGFKTVGTRKGYYTDNREDAFVMTTDPIDQPAYRQKFKSLVEAYRQRRGEIIMQLA